jgi:hypothetical protein
MRNVVTTEKKEGIFLSILQFLFTFRALHSTVDLFPHHRPVLSAFLPALGLFQAPG